MARTFTDEDFATSGPRVFTDTDFADETPKVDYSTPITTQELSSGWLRGVSGLGDLGDLVNTAMSYTPWGIPAMRESNIGPSIREGFIEATGNPNALDYGKDTLTGKIAEYAPGMLLMGPGGVVRRAVETIPTAVGGWFGNKVGGAPGEFVGALAGGNILQALRAGTKGLSSLFSPNLTSDQALMQAFKASDAEDLGGLTRLKDKGVITPELLSSKTPFAEVSNAVRADDGSGIIQALSANIEDELTGTGLKVKDLYPTRASIGENAIKMSEDAVSSVLDTAQENLTKKALIKLFPEDINNVDNLYDDYQKLWTRAKKGDMKAAEKYRQLTNKIQNVEFSGDDLWKIRQYYDSNINWNTPEFKGKAPGWKSLRDSLQENLINITGGKDASTASSFQDLASMMGIEDRLQSMANLELQGKTQGPGLKDTLIDTLSYPIRRPLQKIFGGWEASPKPEQLLAQALGETFPQKASRIPIGTPNVAVPLVNAIRGEDVLDGVVTPSNSEPNLVDLLLSQASDAEPSSLPKPTTPQSFVDQTISKAEQMVEDKTPKAPPTPELISAERVKATEPLVEAVIGQESGGRADAVSPVGAQGLMQIMPATAKDIADELGVEEYDLKDPETNRLFGTYYLNKLIDKFGDVKLALAAYNGGMGRVERLLKKTKGSSFEDIEDFLPEETAKYVPGVLKRLKKSQSMKV